MVITLFAAAALGAMPVPVVALRTDLSSYPSLAALDASTGARVALTVGADGMPLRCDIVAPSTNARLDRIGCALFLHSARFRPAVDEDGRAVAAVVEHGFTVNGGVSRPHDVDFALPVSRLPAPAIAEARVVVDPDGRIASCAVAVGTGVPALDRLVCPGIAAVSLPVARTAAATPLRAMRLVSVGFATGEIARRAD